MGCPDWPKCFGSWVPPSEVSQLPENYREVYAGIREKKNIRFAGLLRSIGMSETADRILSDKSILVEAEFNPLKTWIEYINRLIGVVIGLLIMATMVFAFRVKPVNNTLRMVAVATFLGVVFQGWFGSIVVSTNLTPWTVTIHMFLAIVIIGLLIFLVHRALGDKNQVAIPRVLIILAMASMLVQIFLGTQVREAIDRLVSEPRSTWISQLGLDFIIHRSFSWIVLIFNGLLAVKLWKQKAPKALSLGLIVLILTSFLTGVGMAYGAVPPVLQPVHLTLAIAVIGLEFWILLAAKPNPKTVV
jgi:cytochrome c oxidase assembly protein subunit 15